MTIETSASTNASASTGDDLDAHVAALDRDGFTIIEDAIEPELIEALVATIDRLMVDLAVPLGSNAFLGAHTRRIFNLLSRDPIFARVPLHPGVLPLVERVLDRQCLLSSLTAIEMQPGQAPQPLHADDGSIALPRPHVPIVCVAIWALTDFTEENGCTFVVPGSHRYDRRRAKGESVDAAVRAVMPKGSVVVYNGSIWHGGGENLSSARRMGIVVNHCAGYMRQEENQLLAVPREMVATFPARLQEMVGYGTYRGLMGHVDQRDPSVLLDPSRPTAMIWDRMS
jgi:ectoine hydroxylase-related dioxygenase (phytanoyl-CoA dioxygenase family)